MVSRSNVVAEFRVMSKGTCEVIWLRRLLTELKIKRGAYKALL